MFKISTKIMMTMTLIFSTIMVISSENWFSMWMGLEINMLSFIPMMEEKNNFSASESKMMYFLIQSLGSIMLMFMIIMNPYIMINENNDMNINMNIIAMSMMMKMGMAPMHSWFVNILKKMSWMNCSILMTWQKIAPMYIISNTHTTNLIINLFAIISTITGAIGGINQTSIKSIMAFSSVNHLGWMVMSISYENETWIKYLIIYSIMIIMLVQIMMKNSILYINQMNMNIKSNMEKMNIIIMMLSLGGLPPFIGFLPKWMVIQSLLNTNSIPTIMIMMMSSMITLFYYMRMMSPIIMSNNITNKWNLKNNNNKNINMFILLINLMLPISSIINM